MTQVYQLPFERFDIARPLFADAYFDEACYEAAFLGWQPAAVFVDDLASPRAALMCRSYEYFTAGDPAAGANLRQFIADSPTEPLVFQHMYGYAPLNEAWRDVLLESLPLEVIERMNFRWTPGTPRPDWRAKLASVSETPLPVPTGASGGKPAQCTVLPLERALAERADADRSLFPVPFVHMFWGGYDRYAAHGYGTALMVGERIASAVFSIAAGSRDAIINIDTAPEFQRRGYGEIAAGAFIEATLERGLLPVWDCDKANEPSVKLARRLGFKERQPFVELGMPARAALPLTTGLWSAHPQADGGVIWRRNG